MRSDSGWEEIVADELGVSTLKEACTSCYSGHQNYFHLPLLKLDLPKLLLVLELPSACVHAKSVPSCQTVCDPMDCGLLDSSVRGILQARILEWVAMPSSRSSQPRN